MKVVFFVILILLNIVFQYIIHELIAPQILNKVGHSDATKSNCAYRIIAGPIVL